MSVSPVKVGFWYDRPQEYTGGLNYFKNLLHAVSVANDGRLAPHVFFSKEVDQATCERFAKMATVIRTSVLTRGALLWWLHKILYRVFGKAWVVTWLMRKHGIQVVSHAVDLHGRGFPFKLLSWIPDLQYLHLPHLFPGLDTQKETQRMCYMLESCDLMMLSSYAALQDLQSIAPAQSRTPLRVLQFVSQPSWHSGSDMDRSSSLEALQSRYQFKGPFFFLPNQFWQHKNHKVALEAVRLLKSQGDNVLLLCTGNPRDYRLGKRNTYLDGLRAYIETHALQDNVHILGLIDYNDVLGLMRHCLALLNPSRFEGWSSTVEEGRSLGQRLLLSNISVHLEQNPPRTSFFSPDDPNALAALMKQIWHAPPETPSAERERASLEDLRRRTETFGRGYIRLVKEITGQP
jgi:glycosyltransferase involved in cell wall biosynthesis